MERKFTAWTALNENKEELIRGMRLCLTEHCFGLYVKEFNITLFITCS